MRRRGLSIILALFVVFLCVVACVIWYQNAKHARIEEWSIGITPDGFNWAEVSTGYGVEKKSYSLTEAEYEVLASLLQMITEQNCTRAIPKDAERIDYRLALRYDDQLWLFHCLSNGMIRIVFEDPETAAYYGCDDSRLYVENESLYHYILDLVDWKAE